MWGFLLEMGNVIKHNRPIEHEIGTIVTINNKTCVVVESDDTCDGCVFDEITQCGCIGKDFACSAARRKDGKFVSYKEL